MNIFFTVVVLLGNSILLSESLGICPALRKKLGSFGKQYPTCDEFGNFLPVQIISSWSFCVVILTGKVIPGFGVHVSSTYFHNMDCACALRHVNDPSWVTCQANGNELTPCLKRSLDYTHLQDDQVLGCDENGDYNAVQCKRDRCYCMSKDGRYLKQPNSKPYEALTKDGFTEINCECAVEEYEEFQRMKRKSRNFGCSTIGNYRSECVSERAVALFYGKKFVPRCDCSGKFYRVQCHEDICNCVDPETGNAIGDYSFKKDCSVNDTETCKCALDELNYQKLKLPKHTRCLEKGNYEPCLIKALKETKLNEHSEPKQTIQCDCVGDYKPVQCHEKICYCSNIYGTRIGKYENTICEQEKMSTCLCARDQDEAIRYNEIGRLYFCDRYGNY